MDLVTTPAQLHVALASQPGIVGLVPTMGALHSGHQALIDQARRECEVVVVSVFVNPLQFADFGDCDDYRLYPRDLDADVAVARTAGADIVFAPQVDTMYPAGVPAVWVRAGEMGEVYEGASRPGHFDGVATVVTKLFNLVSPSRAYFGEKDAQQVAVVTRMVRDLNIPVQISTVPIKRTPEGLAESSRNQRLSAKGLEDALALSQVLSTMQQDAAAGTPIDLDAARATLAAAPGVTVDYLDVVDPATLRPLDVGQLADQEVPALALVAAEVEGVRLIDNMTLRK